MVSGIFGAAVVVLVSAGFGLAAVSGGAGGGETVRIEVADGSGMFEGGELGALFLASSADGWAADGRGADGTFVDEEAGLVGWVFEVEREEAGRMAFKFTRGSWATVEVDAAGRDVPNRVVRPRLVDEEGRPVDVVRLTVEGFADQRGERWPDLRAPGARPERSVVGELEVWELSSEVLGNVRAVRVWLPPGYGDEVNEERAYPVLYMHDGQNCFDNATASFGVEWGCDETATALIEAGVIEPMIIVGIDNAGADRSVEYNAPSAVFRARTDDQRRYMGQRGIGDKYLDMVVEELMPRVGERYRVLTGPEHTFMGGSSFGGNITLYAAMRHPGVFGRVLVESPAVPVVGEAFLEEIKGFEGAWPQRVFLAMGTEETGSAAYNAELVQLMDDLSGVFEAAGLTEENGRLRVVVEEGAAHNEAAWAGRLEGAFRFLFEEREGE